VPAVVWEPVQLVEVRLCLTSIIGEFPIPAGIRGRAKRRGSGGFI